MMQGGLKDVAFPRISHEQAGSNRVCCFPTLYLCISKGPTFQIIYLWDQLSFCHEAAVKHFFVYQYTLYLVFHFDIISANSPFSFRFRWAIPGKTILHTWEFSFIINNYNNNNNVFMYTFDLCCISLFRRIIMQWIGEEKKNEKQKKTHGNNRTSRG